MRKTSELILDMVKIDINGLQNIQISDNPFLEQQSKEKKIITSR
jgi:hypothetical protein